MSLVSAMMNYTNELRKKLPTRVKVDEFEQKRILSITLDASVSVTLAALHATACNSVESRTRDDLRSTRILLGFQSLPLAMGPHPVMGHGELKTKSVLALSVLVCC